MAFPMSSFVALRERVRRLLAVVETPRFAQGDTLCSCQATWRRPYLEDNPKDSAGACE